MVLADKARCAKFKEAGVRDFLLSVHGLGDVYDYIVGDVQNASKKQMRAIENCNELGIPLRFNCVLTARILHQLSDIAQLAVEKQVRVVNFIAYNCFEDQMLNGKRSADNVPEYSRVMEYLNNAMDILDDKGIECNLRYFPICAVPERHRKSVYGFQQNTYDLHEWDYASWSWTGMQSQKMKGGETTPPVTLRHATAGKFIVDDRLKRIKNAFRKIAAFEISKLNS